MLSTAYGGHCLRYPKSTWNGNSSMKVFTILLCTVLHPLLPADITTIPHCVLLCFLSHISIWSFQQYVFFQINSALLNVYVICIHFWSSNLWVLEYFGWVPGSFTWSNDCCCVCVWDTTCDNDAYQYVLLASDWLPTSQLNQIASSDHYCCTDPLSRVVSVLTYNS